MFRVVRFAGASAGVMLLAVVVGIGASQLIVGARASGPGRLLPAGRVQELLLGRNTHSYAAATSRPSTSQPSRSSSGSGSASEYADHARPGMRQI